MTYAMHEKLYRDTYNRRCIDGSVTGCGKCVGYCEFAGHSGYLTKEIRKEHNCIEKKCYYYRHKERIVSTEKRKDDSLRIMNTIREETGELEGMKVLRAQKVDEEWIVYYVAIADYQLAPIVQKLKNNTGITVRFELLPYQFDVSAKLIFQKRE